MRSPFEFFRLCSEQSDTHRAMLSKAAPKIFSREYYERLLSVEENHPWTKAMRTWGLELLKRHTGSSPGRLLDAGCGTGVFLAECGQALGFGLAVGCDLSPEALRLAGSRAPTALVAGAVGELPFGSGQFEAVVCGDVLQHLSAADSRSALREFGRLLAPKGTLLIRAAARRGIGKNKHRDTSQYQQWEPEKLNAALENADFEVLFLALVNWLPSLLADLKGLGKPAPVGDEGLRVRALSAHRWKSRILGAYWRVERRLILRLGWRPPGGHTLFCVARKRCPNRTS